MVHLRWFYKNLFFAAIFVLRISITDLATTKISQRKILPSTKVNRCNMCKKTHPRKIESIQKLISRKLISAKINLHVRNWPPFKTRKINFIGKQTLSINENFDLTIDSESLKTIMANYDLKELYIQTSQLSRIPLTDHMFHCAWYVSFVSYMFHPVSQSLRGHILLPGNPFDKWLRLEKVDLKTMKCKKIKLTKQS